MQLPGTRSIYYDQPSWSEPPRADDFIVAIGKTKSNSVYHVASVKAVPQKDKRVIRYYMRVFPSDLLTAIQREPSQLIHTLAWYPRGKK